MAYIEEKSCASIPLTGEAKSQCDCNSQSAPVQTVKGAMTQREMMTIAWEASRRLPRHMRKQHADWLEGEADMPTWCDLGDPPRKKVSLVSLLKSGLDKLFCRRPKSIDPDRPGLQ